MSLSVVNAGVQQHRQAVFRQLAATQVQKLSPKIARSLPTNVTEPEVSPELGQVLSTMERLDWIRSAALYIPDTADPDALWYYDSVPGVAPKFKRIFVSKRLEAVTRAALQGQDKDLKDFINAKEFVWLETIPHNKLRAVLYLKGNPQEDFRDYSISK